jgi:hypothetical protein
MSFYDSASLVFLPSGGAGKDGKAYSIKPVPEYGNELVTNGGFDTNSDWTFIGSANIANGVVNFITVGDFVIQSNVVSLSVETYKIQYEVVSSNNGQLRFAGGNSAFPVTTLPSSVGVHTVIVVSNGTQGSLQFNSNGFIGSIDNVSVKEVIVDGDFTFSRGSNLTATRVDSNGLIEKGRENLLLQSNSFDTTWANSNTDETSGQSGYDGSTDAWLLERTAANGFINQSNASSGVLCFSIYLKSGSYNWAFLRLQDSAGYRGVYFDLENGTTGNVDSGIIDYNIEAIGTNGWYRCSLVLSNTLVRVLIYPSASNGGASLSGTGSIYIQDAQLEIGLVATEPILSGATTGLAGILEDSPRFDYSGGASCPSLLLEPSRTQLIPQSEYITDTLRATITHNQAISPEGLQNAILAVDSTDNNSHILSRGSANLGATSAAVFSVFAKKQNNRYINLRITDNAANVGETINFYNATFDLQSGVVTDDYESATPPTNPFSDIEDYGNGWYRCYVGLTKSSGVARTDYAVYLVNSSSASVNPIYQGTGNDGNYLYGAQLEEGSYPTSYIPNHSGGSVTRNADGSLSNTNFSNIFGSSSLTQYSIFLDIKDGDDTGLTRVLISKGTNTQGRINLLNGNRICYYSVATGYTTGNNYTDGSPHKYLLVADNGTIKQYFDGSLISTDTNTSDEFTAFDIGGLKSMRISQYIIFPTALSDTDCEILTGTSYESFAAMATALNYTTYE